MNSAIERLLSLRVADVMHRNVVTVAATSTMGDAAARFLECKVSGAPVVGEQGKCVGVLSAVDFVRREVLTATDTPTHHRAKEQVRGFMSPAVHSIDADASLIDAARAMCGKHVHRLPVLDRQGQVVGVMSSLDVVAAVVHAIEE